ncbi:MAG: hypothetical protein ACOYO1_08205 [Bacteroidales bacterium]
MKATSLILIFSGIIGLNNCSSDIKLNIPDYLMETKSKTDISNQLKIKNVNDTISTSLFFSPFN